ncbi:hypothetical protein MBOU_52000 [Mycobacterium bourgelatii]|uniref:Uncharacterized protein n=1 Tax=Mycobacterium bourgelatii TaxID=1273442 RepID=A0A7I9YX18_MYCBU|nr:hypothetical protein MBOU_52000 [Mycobacterium bourgelatii]
MRRRPLAPFGPTLNAFESPDARRGRAPGFAEREGKSPAIAIMGPEATQPTSDAGRALHRAWG